MRGSPTGRGTGPSSASSCVLGAVLAFSSSSSIVKWADAPGSVVAFWRMIGAVALWWLVIAARRS